MIFYLFLMLTNYGQKEALWGTKNTTPNNSIDKQFTFFTPLNSTLDLSRKKKTLIEFHKFTKAVAKPKITASIPQPKENDPFILTCDTSNGANISWTKRDINISSETKLSGDNKTLMFYSVRREDSGEYRCEAQNLVSTSTSDPYTVTVAYGPDKIQLEGAAFVRPGSSITLTCSADSFPTPEYQWKLNGSVLVEKTSKYSITNAVPQDEGHYTCAVRNPVTLRTATASVYVSVTAGNGFY
ncbi:cell adhesion molecule CEACAM1-like [Anomaloglossus baeobatrachus]|uniref:cell adhesion molecule CEACAM1-like n=1 Tax=Anomaloglossus baeobatrachus TaxID=238106 RepID=UPI003F50B159